MIGEFLNMAGALSGDEFAGLARELLSELEGRNVPRKSETGKEESAPASAKLAEAAERIGKALEKLMLAAETSAAASGLYTVPGTQEAYSRLCSGEGRTGAPTAGKTISVTPGANVMSGNFSDAAKEGGVMDLEKLSESIRRDFRRCDSGFERY